jgi:ketosteroid isomerase-like protein
MKKIRVITTCLVLLVLFMQSFSFAQGNDALKPKIDKLNKEFAMAMLQGNTDKMLDMYTEDAISLPSYHPMEVGLAEIRKANAEDMKSGWKTTAFELNNQKIITSGNLVTDIGTYKISMSMAGNDKPMEDHGKYLTIYEKQKDGSLKIKVETWNTDVDPMSMMKSDDSKTSN